jgi:hypothetical protein
MVEKEIISVDYKIPKKRKYTGIIEIKAVYDDKIELELIKKELNNLKFILGHDSSKKVITGKFLIKDVSTDALNEINETVNYLKNCGWLLTVPGADLEKVKISLLKICNNSEYQRNLEERGNLFWSKKTKIVVLLSSKGYAELNKAIDELRNDDYIKFNIIKNVIENELYLVLSEAMGLEEDKRDVFIDKKLKNLKSSFLSEKQEWTFVAPIQHLSLDDSLEIGTVSFCNYGEIKDEIKNVLHKLIFENESITDKEKPETYNNAVKDVEKIKDEDIVAITKVKGVFESAKQLALSKIRLAINVIKLYSYLEDDYFGIKGEIISQSSRILIGYNNNRMRIPYEILGPLPNFKIDKDRLNLMSNWGFNILDNILINPNKNNFQDSLLTSIYWFGESCNTKLNIKKENEEIFERRAKKHENLGYFKFGDKFLKLSNALESVLVKKNESITDKLAERTAFLLADKYEDRINYFKGLKELYEIRSQIVHNGDVFVSVNDMIDLSIVVQEVIFKLIKLGDEYDFKSVDDLYNYLEKLKFE